MMQGIAIQDEVHCILAPPPALIARKDDFQSQTLSQTLVG